MTREEARKAAEVMLGFSEGKKIEYKVRGGDEWLPVNELDTPLFDWNSTEYRIKQEPTYRPFRSKEECWAEMQKHQPFGWVKTVNNSCCLINSVLKYAFNDDDCVEIDSIRYKFYEAFEQFTFADGTPFGVKE